MPRRPATRDAKMPGVPPVPRAVRLVTLAGVGEDAGARRISVSARHEAVLEDGRRVLLLGDRGWSQTLGGFGAGEVADIWAVTSAHDIRETARVVVGPDEPFDGRSRDDMERDHWNALAENLRAHGVVMDAGELKQLPHDVVLSEALLERLARGTGDGA
jgi:hypothetical protein